MPIQMTLTRKKYGKERDSFLPTKRALVGFYAVITAVNEDCSVDLKLQNGFTKNHTPVASLEWVRYDKDKGTLTGERRLPPVGSYVFCLCPEGKVEGAFVLCSGFIKDLEEHKAFMKGDALTLDHLSPSGWHTTVGEKLRVCNDAGEDGAETISLEAGDDLTIKVGNSTVTVKGDDIEIQCSGKLKLCGDDLEGLVNSKELKTQLNKLSNRVTTVINALNSGTTTAQDGGAALISGIKAELFPITSDATKKEDFSAIANDKVVQGGGGR